MRTHQTPEQKTFERRRSFGHQVNHLARLFARSLGARIKPLGVAPGQFAQLLALYEEDSLTQSELCERVRIDPSTMAHSLKRMERDGLVKRTRDSADRRQTKVHLTSHAHALRNDLTRAAMHVNALALQDLGDGEADEVLASISKVIDNLESDLEPDEARA